MKAKGDYINALSFSLKSLNTCESIGDDKHTSWTYGNSASIMFMLGDTKKAEELSHIYLNAVERIGNPRDIANAQSGLAEVFMSQCRWDEAISHCQRAFEVRKGFAGPAEIALSWFELGKVHLRKGNYDRAEQIFNEFADSISEFPDDYAQESFFWLLESLEKIYRTLDTREKFFDFCHLFREQHAHTVEKFVLQQWYLETAQSSNAFPHLTFFDDFDTKTIDSSWTWIDIYGDCSCNIRDSGGLEICSANGRDLFRQNISAPRLMHEISGDFAVEVCVSPATKEKPQLGGLLVWKDDENYIRLKRGDSDPYGFWFYGYINRKQHWVGRGFLPAGSEATYIRFERISDEFSAYVSIDGIDWLTCGKLTMKIDDPIQVGIYAHGMIDRTVYCGEYREGSATLFHDFRIWTRD